MRHSPLRAHGWVAWVIVMILVAGHGIILYYFSSRLALSAAVVSGLLVLIVIKHLGLLGSAHAFFRRRARHDDVLPDDRKAEKGRARDSGSQSF